ncbi:molybdopterin molybdotransferase MoeA [Erythrobacter insulae]|uniref:Molybdopterin molybdenumtransferase n=1 Tax=Erythrobacter insulae TaxID=2584124 RepID=A0A547PEJ6_9SPHN|nr:molybdopterin molybdotransferase MoeA [Erythrobacter insulae]TRD12565.1 molybdopterin molybdotransferase MoeA [Erythrobacter insulae]
MSGMLTLPEAQAQLFALAPKMPGTHVETHLASGRYLAKDIAALRSQPSADLSAMDGYAISGAGPWKLIGESRAGAPFGAAVKDGQCIRISTGAQMPEGSDRVLIQENAELAANFVELAKGEVLPEPARHVRSAGFDFAIGQVILTSGTLMGPAQIALALAAGHHAILVHRIPRIAVIDSGDELVRLPAKVEAHQIPASNGMMINAMLRPLAGDAALIGPVPDNLDALAHGLDQASDCDIIITSGGASVGDHDLVQQALRNWGAELTFWKVAIKPGKPLMIATRQHDGRKTVILGLPGNPVSSFVTCFLFALPLIRAAMGNANPLPNAQNIIAAVDLPATGNRREFLRGISDGDTVRPAAIQDSSALMALAQANCLIDRPAGSPAIKAGDRVAVYNIDNGAIQPI